jgi:hypothetical protein
MARLPSSDIHDKHAEMDHGFVVDGLGPDSRSLLAQIPYMTAIAGLFVEAVRNDALCPTSVRSTSTFINIAF